MTQPAKATEPSMEEILASIRRIISDDDPANKAPAIPPKPMPPVAPPRIEATVRPVPMPPPPKPVPLAREVPPAPAQPAAAPAPVEADILELTEDMAAEPPAPESAPEQPATSSFRTIDGQPDVFFAEAKAEPVLDPEPEPFHARHIEDMPVPSGFDSRAIISQATSAAVDSAFNQLAASVFTQNGQTIEGLVREMLRPMLKTWLDDNLPGLVERLVRAEIERVSRGR